MATLKERLEEVMDAMGWEHRDVMRASGQTSSVVSQWLGKGSKEIKSIGKLEAVLGIERESGYSALWVGKGLGPKMAPAKRAAAAASLDTLLEDLSAALATVPPGQRGAVASNLHGLAMDGGAEHWQVALKALLQKQRARA
jgi:hypothetical protein